VVARAEHPVPTAFPNTDTLVMTFGGRNR